VQRYPYSLLALKAHQVAPRAEFGVIISADHDLRIGKHGRVNGEGKTRLALYVALQADVVDFGEIKGLAGLLAGAGTMTLANNIDNHN